MRSIYYSHAETVTLVACSNKLAVPFRLRKESSAEIRAGGGYGYVTKGRGGQEGAGVILGGVCRASLSTWDALGTVM